MATQPENEEPGFEHDVNELDEGQTNTSEHSTEEKPENLEDAQAEAAEERKEEGGYQ